VGFFDLIEENNRIRPAANRFCKLATFLVAYISAEEADQAG